MSREPVRDAELGGVTIPEGTHISFMIGAANHDEKVFDDPDRFKKAVHLQDIHLEKGMQCADCHFDVDVHGNGNLYGEVRNAITIGCEERIFASVSVSNVASQ